MTAVVQTRWQDMSPAQVLDAHPALTLTQVAYVLGLVHIRGAKKGQPSRRAALDLVQCGRLALIDASRPNAYWAVSSVNVRRYLEGGKS